MFAVQTKSTLSRAPDPARLPSDWLSSVVGDVGARPRSRGHRDARRHRLGPAGRRCGVVDQVEVARAAQRDEHVVQRLVDRAAGRVDPYVGVLRLLVGRGDARELGDLAPPRLGVEALAVAPLALLERRRDVDEEEGAAGLGDVLPHLLAGRVERRDRAAHRDPAVPRDLGGDPADPSDVGLAVLLGEGEAGRQVPAYDVAVEAGQRATAALEQSIHQCLGEGRLAAAGEAGEEDDQALLVGCRPVRVHDVGHGGGRHAAGREVDDRVRPGVVGDDLCAQGRVRRRVAVRSEGYGDHVDRVAGLRDQVGDAQRRAEQADRGQGRGAAADEGQQRDVAEPAQLGDLLVGDGIGDGDEGAAGVLLADVGGPQVEAAEGTVLRVGQRADRPAGAGRR